MLFFVHESAVVLISAFLALPWTSASPSTASRERFLDATSAAVSIGVASSFSTGTVVLLGVGSDGAVSVAEGTALGGVGWDRGLSSDGDEIPSLGT